MGFADMLEVEDTPLLEYLSSTVASVRIRGLPLKDYFSKEHVSEAYRGATLFGFPLYRIVDLILFQVTGFPQINIQETFDYMRNFAIGAIQVRMAPSSDVKDSILRILESFKVTFASDGSVSLDSLDVPLILDVVEKKFVSRGLTQKGKGKGKGKSQPCRCTFTLLDIDVEANQTCNRSSIGGQEVCLALGKGDESVALAVAPAFHRTWNVIQNQRTRKRASGEANAETSQDFERSNFKFFSKEFFYLLMRSIISDILLAVGSSGYTSTTTTSSSSFSRGLFDLDVARDVCISYRKSGLCAQSVM